MTLQLPTESPNLAGIVAERERYDREWAARARAILDAALAADPATLPPQLRAACVAFRAAAEKEGGVRA